MSAKDNWLANVRHIVDSMQAKDKREAYLMVSEVSGVSSEYIYQLYVGKPRADGEPRYPGNSTIEKLKKAFGDGKPANWFDLPPDAPITRLKTVDSDDLTILQYDAGGAMGHGLILEEKQPGIIKSWKVDHEWLRLNVRHHTGVNNLCIVTGFGPSMQPKYNPGDPLLLDQGVTSVDSEGIYFFRVGKHGFIKQLQRIPTEAGMIIRAKSLNSTYDPFDISAKMDFQVFGKVLTVWKSEQV